MTEQTPSAHPVDNPTSALFWYPRLQVQTELPLPLTEFVPYDHFRFMLFLEGDPEAANYGDYPREVAQAVGTAIKAVGLPAFVRTDLSSAKHDGPASYRVMLPTDLLPVVSATVSDNEMKFWMAPDRNPQAFLVRQWLDLAGGFRAFGMHGQPGHLIAREFRVFVYDDGREGCWHPYWPEHSIEDHRPDRDDWRDVLAEQSRLDDTDRLDLLGMAAEAAGTLQRGSWSVDFAQDRDGDWWLIDMAVADESFHPEHEQVNV